MDNRTCPQPAKARAHRSKAWAKLNKHLQQVFHLKAEEEKSLPQLSAILHELRVGIDTLLVDLEADQDAAPN